MFNLILIITKGHFGLKLQQLCKNIFQNLITMYIIIVIIFFIVNLLYIIYTSILNFDSYFSIFNTVNSTGTPQPGNVPLQDPVRWWPSGVPQTWAILAGMFGAYKIVSGSPRIKVLAAFGSLGITAPAIVLHSAIENPVGFHTFMHNFIVYKRTGHWPAPGSPLPSAASIENTLALEAAKEAESLAIPTETGSNLSINSSINDKLLPSGSSIEELINNLVNSMVTQLLNIFKPINTIGFLDDLVGQQMFILILLLIITMSIILLFILYVFNNILLHNKVWLINRFNNRFIKLYIRYQIFIVKLNLIYLPIIIFIGLFSLFIGLQFLVTHPIPFDTLDLDLHTIVGRK